MSRSVAKACIVSLLVARCLASLSADELRDPSEEYVIGVAAFTGERLERENGYLLSSIPLLLRDSISELRLHHLDEAERTARAQAVINDQVRAARKELGTLYASYDKQFPTGNADQRVTTEKRIVEARAALDGLLGTGTDEVIVSDTKPIRFVEGQDSRLVPEVITSAEARARVGGYDLLIYGSIEQLDEYLYVQVSTYESAGGRRQTYETAGSREAIKDRVAEIADSLISMVYGAPWGRLEIVTEDQNSRLWYDDKYLGTGTHTISVADPGDHRILVRTPGFEDSRYDVTVVAGETETVSAVPGEAVVARVDITTDPEGAAIYIGSIYRGISPSVVLPPLERTQLKLDTDGYNAFQRPIDPHDSEIATVDLIPAAVDESQVVRSRRSVFYRSLGLFAASVPIPMILLDLTNELTLEFNLTVTEGAPIQASALYLLRERRQAALAGYVGGMFLAGALFVNAIIDLLEYIDVVGLSTG